MPIGMMMMAKKVAAATIETLGWVAIEDLQFSEVNPNQGDTGAIYESIRHHGYNDIIQKWQQNTVKGGEHRIKALALHIKEGLQPRDGTDGKPVDQCWRIRDGRHEIVFNDIAFMAESQANAFMIALNRTAELSQNDPQALADLLQELANEDRLPQAGFSGEALDDLLASMALPDEFPEYDESVADEVEFIKCPNCDHEFPK